MKLDALIIGAGPTGLMIACQLLRFGISFRIIDKQMDRTNESRAFGIQAKSIEIFDSLGIADEFLKKAIKVNHVNFFVNGQHALELKFNSKALEGTAYPHIYILPQSETEKILIDFLKKSGVEVERNTVLEKFEQNNETVSAQIKNLKNEQKEIISCQYLFGCDGAHSTIRKLLKIPFEGDKYKQTFFLADANVAWPKDIPEGFKVFYDDNGLLLQAPLDNNLTRLIGSTSNTDKVSQSLDLNSITHFARNISHHPVIIKEITWKSLFRLHHRVVSQYQNKRVFLLGDAAHIHSPVGAQGMNTGLQDAANLAWKIALKLKVNTSDDLIKTYQLERQFIGKKLTNTTDRIFWILTSPHLFLRKLRPLLIKLVLKIIHQYQPVQNKLFVLISQLAIRYPFNDYIYELTEEANPNFVQGPSAGSRAPDAIMNGIRLFEQFKNKPFNIIIFYASETMLPSDFNQRIDLVDQNFNQWIGLHKIPLSEETQSIYQRYGITQHGLYLIRPDGYIGFRSYQIDLDALNIYLKKLFSTNTL